MSEEREWVLVRGESELKAGLVVKILGAINTHRTLPWGPSHTAVGMLTRYMGKTPCPGHHRECPSWDGTFDVALCVRDMIPEGRMFRLETGESDAAQQEQGRKLYAPKKVAHAKAG